MFGSRAWIVLACPLYHESIHLSHFDLSSLRNSFQRHTGCKTFRNSLSQDYCSRLSCGENVLGSKRYRYDTLARKNSTAYTKMWPTRDGNRKEYEKMSVCRQRQLSRLSSQTLLCSKLNSILSTGLKDPKHVRKRLTSTQQQRTLIRIQQYRRSVVDIPAILEPCP